MEKLLATSLILVAVCLAFLVIPEASALPVSYNTTAINLGLNSIPRNSSSYDVFTLNQDNWLWEKFDNNTIDSGPLSVASTITYNTNLKALWKFENTLSDSTTNGYNGVVTGTTTYASGHEGQGFSFNGASYITTSAQTGSVFSWSYWVNVPSFSTCNCIVISHAFGANEFLSFIDAGGHLVFDITGQPAILTSTGTITTNTWNHIVFVYDGTKIQIYINGVFDSQVNYSLTGAESSTTILGSRSGGASFLTGKLDEVRLYKIALSSSQVSALDEVGKYSQSHTFDGGEYVTAGNSLPTGNSPRTISAWVYPTANGAGGGFFGYGTTGAGNSFNGWFLGDNGLSCSDLVTANPDSPTKLSLNTWQYIACVYDGSHMIGYINGVQQFNVAYTETTGSGNLLIGARYDTAQITGQIDNLKVYPYALSSSQITSDYNSISPISSGKQFMSWYHGVSGSSTLVQKLGSTKSSLSLSCNLGTWLANVPSNNTNLYYMCLGVNTVHQLDINSATDTTYFHALQPLNTMGSQANGLVLFPTLKNIIAFIADPSGASPTSSTKTLNVTLSGPTANAWNPISNQKVGMSGYEIKYNYNNTLVTNSGVTTNPCEINYIATNTTKVVDAIQCDKSIPAKTIRYWNGMAITGAGNYATNSTQQFLSSIDASAYKKLLSLPCLLLVNETPCTTFIMTDFTNTDWFIVLTSTHVYYGNAQTALTYLTTHNYALQSYDIVTPLTTSAYEIQNPILQGITLYGFNLNTTINQAGLFTLPSGYTTKTTTINSAIRLIDPRWTNDNTDIPIITTTQSLFPIYLTASNAPSFAAIKVTSGTQIINGQESVYAVAQLDSTRSVEFDLVAGTCANIYIADISVSPTVWNFEGILCATGVNQKTVAYVNTVPYTFYSLKYGVTDSYVPANNGLQTTFRTQAAPTTYTVIVRNSTGTVAINQTFTVPANQTVDTRTFNVSSVTKPAALSVTVGGNQIYSAYLGSPLSLSNMASFFHQYFNYQGFDFLSFIPVIFASMFTRNTVGVGMALTVICIATLSWLSIVVVPEPVVYVSIFISVIGMVGYRAYGYF